MSVLEVLRGKVRALGRNLRSVREEEAVLIQRGHRHARWEQLGRLEFDFLVAQGLRPEHVLLDIGCGSLRGGRLFVPFLNPGNYLGIDRRAQLVAFGRHKELTPAMVEAKRPEFVISESFEFERFTRRPHYCLAESLFTHLDERDIRRCFQKLTDFVGTGCRFFAVFQETAHKIPQSTPSHSHRVLYYTRAQMEHFGRDCGWEPKHHGNWPHAKHQLMIEYVKR